MHDVTHYAWMQQPALVPDATTVPAARHRDGRLMFWSAERDVAEALAAETGGAEIAVKVYANHGRWIVECPDCKDAQLAVRDDLRFMCVLCGNASVDGLWRPVVWPKDHPTIEELLDARPDHKTRNWEPGEKVSALRAENIENGVG